MRYGSGLPLNRIAKLQKNLGVPLPTSTQWDVIEKAADRVYPIYTELIRQAAQGNVIHNDDTNMKILDLLTANQGSGSKRKGIFTTGILSIIDNRKIALFFTGRQHAGENMRDLLQHRKAGLAPPIQMCDALSRNFSEEFNVVLANCLVHGRRNFSDVAQSFPDECQFVFDTLGQVYHNDAITKEQQMSPGKRLLFHQTNSKPLMEKLHRWFNRQFDERFVEKNSGLGKAIQYMLNHWKELTLFLSEPTAPLDNNICERALKMAILHRKNSLFYKTEHGAYIGDLFMSIIHTCSLSKINYFDYLTELQKHSSAVFQNPSRWLPWNYQNNLAK